MQPFNTQRVFGNSFDNAKKVITCFLLFNVSAVNGLLIIREFYQALKYSSIIVGLGAELKL